MYYIDIACPIYVDFIMVGKNYNGHINDRWWNGGSPLAIT